MALTKKYHLKNKAAYKSSFRSVVVEQYQTMLQTFSKNINRAVFLLLLGMVPLSANALDCELPDGDIDGDECITQNLPKNNGGPCSDSAIGQTCVGNPVNVATGNKFQNEIDFVSQGPLPLILNRSYNSMDSTLTSLGVGWRIAYSRSISSLSSTSVNVIRDDGKVLVFTLRSGVWTPDADINAKLVQTSSGWRYTNSLDDTENYNVSGKLISVSNRAGLLQSFGYDAQGHLSSISDPFGHQMSLTYTGSLLTSVTVPDGGIYSYGYDNRNNLVKVTYPDLTFRTLLYENITYPHALTGIIDETGNRFATYSYDGSGRAISTEHAGGVEKYTVDFNYLTYGYVPVHDALNVTRTSYFTNIHDVPAETLMKRNCPDCSTSDAVTQTTTKYDANGNIIQRTDYNGNITTYSYDTTRNLELSRTEAYGTPLARTISTTWDANYRLPLQIVEPNRTTTFSYDTQGNLLRKTLSSGGQSRTWTLTYNTNGQPLTVDGPRTDVSDVTRYTYDAQGNLSAITDALGHVTYLTTDADGRPLSITDPNNLVTTLAYDLRGKLISSTTGSELTLYHYDAAQQLVQVQRPDNSTLNYHYDNAHRLTSISDSLGNQINYTLDAMGNRIKTEVLDPSGTLTQTQAQVFSGLSRMAQVIGAQNQTSLFNYDANGNVIQTTDALGHATGNQYDALDHLIQTTDALGGVARYSYDALDQLKNVTDPRNLATNYVVNALGDQTRLISPDTGTTPKTYDSAGNLATVTDARGKVTTYTYDALNRVTSVSYTSGTGTTFTYDTGTNAVGRLSKMTDASGSTTWSYNTMGRIAAKTQVIRSVTSKMSYGYDAAGHLISLTYPSGKVVTYSYNPQGQVASIAAGGVPVVTNIQYQAFGPAKTWNWGNGLPYARNFDTDGRITSFPLGSGTRTLSFDAASRVSGYTDTNPALSQQFYYDNLDRLTSWVASSSSENFSYDANGNRTNVVMGSTLSTYTYPATSNQLTAISGGTTDSINYDAMGNIISQSGRSYQYADNGRLSSITTGKRNTVSFVVNGLGQRVNKNNRTLFMYDASGHMVGEYSHTGAAIEETLYLNDTPVAVLKNRRSDDDDKENNRVEDEHSAEVDHDDDHHQSGKTQLYYVYTDHLNAPRQITDTRNNLVWSWDADPFGTTAANENPSGRMGRFTYNLRFPGQYYDKETGLHYNYFRDYDPSTGRYVESDPIGLRGGVNTYGGFNLEVQHG